MNRTPRIWKTRSVATLLHKLAAAAGADGDGSTRKKPGGPKHAKQ
jgi:hypothetical protein